MQLPDWINASHFLVKIDREKQRLKREKIGSIYVNPNNVFMTLNQQCGEVVRIGSYAGEQLPEAWIGDTIYFHHSIEGSLDDRKGDKRQRHENAKHLALEDETFRYYMVHINETYAVRKMDGSIFTTKDWILCHPYTAPKQGVELDEHGRELVKSDSGLILFSSFDLTDNEKMQKIEWLKKEMESLSKTGVDESEFNTKEKNNTISQVRRDIATKMDEMTKLSRSMNGKQYVTYTMVYGNKFFNKLARREMDDSWILYYYSIGKQGAPTIEMDGKTYHRVKTNMVHLMKKKL